MPGVLDRPLSRAMTRPYDSIGMESALTRSVLAGQALPGCRRRTIDRPCGGDRDQQTDDIGQIRHEDRVACGELAQKPHVVVSPNPIAVGMPAELAVSFRPAIKEADYKQENHGSDDSV